MVEKLEDDGVFEGYSLTMAEVMSPDKVNFSGHVHGGHIMLLMDRVAGACSSRYSGRYTVTLSADHILFKEPVFVGELVIFHASINFVGNSSMEVGIKVVAENLRKQTKRHTNTCYFTMVALDDDGKPVKVRPLDLKTEEQKRRHAEALFRKEQNKEYSARHKEFKSKSKKS
jgi:acyl-CoA hydrolase